MYFGKYFFDENRGATLSNLMVFVNEYGDDFPLYGTNQQRWFFVIFDNVFNKKLTNELSFPHEFIVITLNQLFNAKEKKMVYYQTKSFSIKNRFSRLGVTQKALQSQFQSFSSFRQCVWTDLEKLLLYFSSVSALGAWD